MKEDSRYIFKYVVFNCLTGMAGTAHTQIKMIVWLWNASHWLVPYFLREASFGSNGTSTEEPLFYKILASRRECLLSPIRCFHVWWTKCVCIQQRLQQCLLIVWLYTFSWLNLLTISLLLAVACVTISLVQSNSRRHQWLLCWDHLYGQRRRGKNSAM